MLLTGAALTLLPLVGVRAQSADPSNPWLQCEIDELAGDIVPATPNAPPPDELPMQGEAGRLDSSPTESRLEGNAKLSRGDQRLRAETITLERTANRARADGGFVYYGDPQQALRGQRAEVDLNAETGRFREVDYYLPARNAQGHAEEVKVDRRQRKTWLEDATYSTCRRGREVWELRARDIRLNEKTGRGSARDMVLVPTAVTTKGPSGGAGIGVSWSMSRPWPE